MCHAANGWFRYVSAVDEIKLMTTVTQQQAQRLERARREILDSDDWLTTAELLALGSPSDWISVADLRLWLCDDQIFALRSDGADYFPRYALDVERDYQPILGLDRAIRLLKTTKSEWEIAFWFASLNSYLGGQRPQDILHHRMESVFEAAQQELAEISHG